MGFTFICYGRNTLYSLSLVIPVASPHSIVGFCGGRKTLGARTKTNNKLNPHITAGPGIEPGPHWPWGPVSH